MRAAFEGEVVMDQGGESDALVGDKPAEQDGGFAAVDGSRLPYAPQPKADLLPPLYQELLEAYARLQERCRRRTVALAAAAHELKTPLSIISGYIELLLDQRVGPLNQRQAEILRDSQSNCDRLRKFIHDFLTYGALETGQPTLHRDRADLNACLGELYQMWLPRFQKKGVALYFHSSDRLAPFYFDYHKVQQIVSNLLENALKFTPAGGTGWMAVEPHLWERRSYKGNSVPVERRTRDVGLNAARITVSDSGPGIPPEYHQEVFDDFFRLPQPGNETTGTGLGLAIARRLVLAHGGKIWVESEPGAGCKFSFLLPFNPS